MRLSMSAAAAAVTSKQVQQPLVNFPRVLNMESFIRWKDKVVIVMGATGTGKSRLAIDLATHFQAEIVNSDKMQVYKGLDIVTNKVTEEERRGVPHHLLGTVEPDSNFTANDFCHHASDAVDSIVGRRRLPIIAGGSNSYIDALVNDHAEFRLKYECCFLWVDVSLPILHASVSERVDRMVKDGLIDEVRKMFEPDQEDYSRGIRRAIGMPEMDQFLRSEATANYRTRSRLLEEAITKIKKNTRSLAFHQLQKIHRFYSRWNWNIHRIDATQAFLSRGEEADEAWEELVAAPSAMIVGQFLYNEDRHLATAVSPETSVISVAPVPMAAVAAATR